MDTAPSWTELLGRMAAVSFSSAIGRVAWHHVTDRGEVSEGSDAFWFRRSGDMRIDGEVGTLFIRTNDVTLRRDHAGKMQLGDGHARWNGPGDPTQMLGGPDWVRDLGNPNDFSAPLGPGTPTEIDGRRGWAFVLQPPPHKSHPLRVVIDDETAVILEWRSIGVDNWTMLTDFETDVEIDDSVFAYDGPVATDDIDRHRRRQELARLVDEPDWPTPRYWPTGMGLHLFDADPATGAFVGMLEDRSGAVFARWPDGNEEPASLTGARPGFHVHRWIAHGFEWALAVESPFSDDDLERIKASIPHHR